MQHPDSQIPTTTVIQRDLADALRRRADDAARTVDGEDPAAAPPVTGRPSPKRP